MILNSFVKSYKANDKQCEIVKSTTSIGTKPQKSFRRNLKDVLDEGNFNEHSRKATKEATKCGRAGQIIRHTHTHTHWTKSNSSTKCDPQRKNDGKTK